MDSTLSLPPVELQPDAPTNIDNIDSPGPKLAGPGLTKFHKYMDLPLELRARIMEVNMFEDEAVTAPRIIRIYMNWNPEKTEWPRDPYRCTQPSIVETRNVSTNETSDDDDDEDGDEDEDEDGDQSEEDDGPYIEINPDHANFAWRIYDDAPVRSSHRPLIPYFTVSKECKQIVESFLLHQMARREGVFWSPQLGKLPLNPLKDAFFIDCPPVWEAVNEWAATGSLEAAHDAQLMRNFMVDFKTFHGLVVPALRKKDEFLLDISDKEASEYFTGESSMAAVFKNAILIFVLRNADKKLIDKGQYFKIWHENYQEEGVPDDADMPSKVREVLQSVWREENSEFNGLRDHDGELPFVFWATVPK